MRRQDSSQEGPFPGVRGRRPFLISVALLVVGIGCVAFALVHLAESRAEPLPFAGNGRRSQEVSASVRSRVTTVAAVAQAAREDTPTTTSKTVAQSRPPRGMKFGTLTIPVLGRTLPVIEGTDAAQLEKGVGHVSRSALPGQGNNCVLSGHRDTVFSRLGKVRTGALLIVRTSEGEFTYKVRRVRIVHKDDTTVIVPTDHAVLTVTTCYPFSYVGAAPDRYVLVADLIKSR